ncbi:OmpA family protein [Methylocystis sp. JAN1]|uniref:OmpA family protein n=1 Tax=Methylocystis sp. JAN1 TaxID=3397211 RepID=UPI003FA1F550
MLDFYAFLWPWLTACLAVGAATGALAAEAPTRRGPARWLIWAALASLAAAASVALGAAQGAISIHVESALACFVSFIAGCLAGAGAMRRSLAAHERWALGLAPAALLWFGATHVAQPAYQAALQKRVAALAQAAGVDAAGVALSGRDVMATSAVLQDQDLMAQIAAAPGVRRVVDASPRQERAEPAPKPADVRPDATATIPPQPQVPPPDGPREVLAALPAGDLDAATCQRALDAVAASEPVAFHAARATVNRRVALALDKAAEIIRRCPDTTIEVRGHGDEGAADALSQRRAAAAERYLRREGVAGRRLVAVGCCAQNERHVGTIDYIVR